MRLTSLNSRATAQAAKILAQEIKQTSSLTVLGLTGDLGAGKTTFIKGLIKGLGVRRKIVSPTFLIMRKFPMNKTRSVYHVDAYRINEPNLLKLGFKETLKSPNVVVVEWADRVKRILPRNTIWIKLEHGQKENERYLTFNRR